MLRKWLLWGVVAAAGAVTWNEYRLWTHHSAPARLQVEAPARAAEPLAVAKSAGEEECDAVVIDLSALQNQTAEPATADTAEPATGQFTFGVGVNTDAGLVGSVVVNVPAQFQKHSADGDCCAAGKLAHVCKKIASFVWGTSPGNGAQVAELLQVMPRPVESAYHHDHPGCPYTGGCPYDGAAYRRSAPSAGPAGEESQDAPPAKPKVGDQRKQPKLDTMEIRPGDLPRGWFRKPF